LHSLFELFWVVQWLIKSIGTNNDISDLALPWTNRNANAANTEISMEPLSTHFSHGLITEKGIEELIAVNMNVPKLPVRSSGGTGFHTHIASTTQTRIDGL